jgi:ribosomal protein L37E
MREIPCCFECWPGGPVTPPPCRRCGSKENYFTSGLCSRCHHHTPGPKSPKWESPGKLRRRPVKVASCPDCLAWGVTARYGWTCVACKSWREKYGTDSQCATCGRSVPVSADGSRLLFGMSIANAAHWATTIDRITEPSTPDGGPASLQRRR